jgi:hypothetical protein
MTHQLKNGTLNLHEILGSILLERTMSLFTKMGGYLDPDLS